MLFTLDEELNVAASAALQQRGCVYIIGLDGIRQQVGERWDRLKEMVWTRLDNLLRQKLTPTDFFVRVNELAFLVSLPSASCEEAEVFCLRVAHELHIGLLGSCQAADLQVSRSIRFSDNMIETAPVENAERGLPGAAPAAPAPMPEPHHPLLHPAAPASNARVQDVEINHRYMPIWDAHKEAIASYRCLSLFDHAPVENLGFDRRAKFDLGVTTLRIRHGTALLSQGLAAGGKFLLWLPVSYDMLSSPAARTEISQLCRSLPSELRSYLVFEISDLPYGVPQSRLFDLMSALKPYCRGMVAQLPARIANYGAYLGAGLQAIGLSLLAGGAGSTEMESEIFKLTAAARRQHIMCFVFDIPNEDLLEAARDLGVHMLSSPLIGLPLEAPAPVRRLFARDIPKMRPRGILTGARPYDATATTTCATSPRV